MTFDTYIDNNFTSFNQTRRFSDTLLSFLKIAYEKHNIKVAPFFNIHNTKSENEIMLQVNDLIRKQYKVKFHNVGKDPFKRYFKLNGGFEWLKLEVYLVNHFYAIQKSESYISNKKMAIALGYMDHLESDKEIIKKACRKVSDNLTILKNDRKTITVEQRFNAGKKGSYHLIRANWIKIIDLYTKYDDNADGSIRFRKSIRYRIISLLKNIRRFGQALAELMKKQKTKHLSGLIDYDGEEFQINKYAVFRFMRDFKWLAIRSEDFNTDKIVPIIENRDLTLVVKDEYIYKELTYNNLVVREFKNKYRFNATIKPMF
jgi:predicted DNA-binding protein (MmcQ/YjbR family)